MQLRQQRRSLWLPIALNLLCHIFLFYLYLTMPCAKPAILRRLQVRLFPLRLLCTFALLCCGSLQSILLLVRVTEATILLLLCQLFLPRLFIATAVPCCGSLLLMLPVLSSTLTTLLSLAHLGCLLSLLSLLSLIHLLRILHILGVLRLLSLLRLLSPPKLLLTFTLMYCGTLHSILASGNQQAYCPAIPAMPFPPALASSTLHSAVLLSPVMRVICANLPAHYPATPATPAKLHLFRRLCCTPPTLVNLPQPNH